MAIEADELDLLRDLRERSRKEGSIFWTEEDELAVFDFDLAHEINSANYRDLTLPDKLGDLLLGRKSAPVFWQQVRAAWSAQLRRLADANVAAQLAARMVGLLDQRLEVPLDLVRLAQDVSAHALIPIIIEGLPPAAMQRVLRAHELRVTGLLNAESSRRPLKKALHGAMILFGAAQVVRSELRDRAAGSRPRRLDLTDTVVNLLSKLGLGRGVAAVTGLMAAIGGPPGAAVACLLYEIVRQPNWAALLRAELSAIRPSDFYAQVDAAPSRVAPLTHRFVKETLRLWSPPLLLTRPVHKEIRAGTHRLRPGQRYLLSPHLIHHDASRWQDPETFDPDRWLPEAPPGACPAGCYIPFGFAPRACIGASLGTTLLMLTCYLLSTAYRLHVPDPQALRMSLAAAALPVEFVGTLARRAG